MVGRSNAVVLGIVLASLMPLFAQAAPLGTAFTYQGRLLDNGLPVTGLVDLRFQIWDSAVGGAPVTAAITLLNVNVVNGLFTAPLNFGVAPFDGEDRFLEVEAAVPSGGALSPLSPRQRFAPTPYALQTRGIFVDPLLNAGIGTTAPTARLHVAGGDLQVDLGGARSYQVTQFGGGAQGLVALSENVATAEFTTATGTSQIGDGSGFFQALNRDGLRIAQLWADADGANNGLYPGELFIRSAGGGPGGEISVRNDDDVETIELLGGASGGGGGISLFDPASGAETVALGGDTAGFGGRISTLSESGALQAAIEPDFNGEGAFMTLRRNDVSTGLSFDGNASGSGNSRLSIFGATRSVVFDTNASGDDSVLLPAGSISPNEMFGEPGVGSANSDALVNLTGGVDSILSRTIAAPADGFVLAIATCQANVIHASGTTDNVSFGVSDTAGSFPSTQDVGLLVSSTYPTGNLLVPVTVQAIFPVSPGAVTFFFLGQELSGTVSVNDMTLSLIYFPTSYGAVMDPLIDGGAAPDPEIELRQAPAAPLTDADIAAEQHESAELHQLRVQQELESMRTQMARLQAQLEQVQQEQRSMRPMNRARIDKPPTDPAGRRPPRPAAEPVRR